MHISFEHRDALQELLNIGVGRAAGTLNQMLEKPIHLHIPSIQLGKMDELSHRVMEIEKGMLSSVQLRFKGTFTGTACLLFPIESVAALVTALTGESENTDLANPLREATMTEIGNIVLNSVMGTVANLLQNQITYSVPVYQETSFQKLFQRTPITPYEMTLWAQTRFTIEDYDLTGDIILLLGIPDLGRLMNAVNGLTPLTLSHHDWYGHPS
jgi:chemotaxis protein CheC